MKAKREETSETVLAALDQAAALIEGKRYGEARRLLVKIDHPTADKWLARLDAHAPYNHFPSVMIALLLAAAVVLLLLYFGRAWNMEALLTQQMGTFYMTDAERAEVDALIDEVQNSEYGSVLTAVVDSYLSTVLLLVVFCAGMALAVYLLRNPLMRLWAEITGP